MQLNSSSDGILATVADIKIKVYSDIGQNHRKPHPGHIGLHLKHAKHIYRLCTLIISLK